MSEEKKLNFCQKVADFRPTRRRLAMIAVIALVIALVIAAVLGIFMGFSGGSTKLPVAIGVSPTASASPTTEATPTPSASPTSTGSQAPKAPSVTKTDSTAKSSAKPAPKCEVPVVPPASSDSAHEAKEAVKALLRQNMKWNDVYGGKFYFQHEHPSQETMVDVYNRVDRDGPQRAGLDLAGIYAASNWSKIYSQLKAVTGPCAKLAQVDLTYGEGAQLFWDDWRDAVLAKDTAWQEQLMRDANAAAERFLYRRNKVLMGQAS